MYEVNLYISKLEFLQYMYFYDNFIHLFILQNMFRHDTYLPVAIIFEKLSYILHTVHQ